MNLCPPPILDVPTGIFIRVEPGFWCWGIWRKISRIIAVQDFNWDEMEFVLHNFRYLHSIKH